MNPGPHHTEESIRDDLEHIHNSVVTSVRIEENKVYICTNSVHKAIYARTCMMSRMWELPTPLVTNLSLNFGRAYRGANIAWAIDECASPYEQQPIMPVAIPHRRIQHVDTENNRFLLLDTDNHDDTTTSDQDWWDHDLWHDTQRYKQQPVLALQDIFWPSSSYARNSALSLIACGMGWHGVAWGGMKG